MPYIGNVTTSSNVNGSQINNGTITGDKLSLPFDYDSATLYLDSVNNRVGIGTTSPQNLLDVAGSNGRLILANGNTSNGMKITVANSAYNANGYLAFEGYSTEYGRFDSSGRLGIGTTTPDSKLSVDNTRSDTAGSGFFAITGNTSAKRGLRLNTTNGLCFDLYDGSAWSQQAVLTSGGNVGIGTTSPGATLHISGPANVATANPVLKVVRNNNSGSVSGQPEIGIDVSIPNTFNDASVAYGVKVFTSHNLGVEHYAGYFEAAGSAYSNGIGVYAKTTHTDTNGNGYQPAVLADAYSTIGASNTGYAVALEARTNNYINNENIRVTSLYTGSSNQFAMRIIRNATDIGGIRTNTTSTSYRTSTTAGFNGVDGNTLSFETSSLERARIDSSGRLLVGTSTDTTARLVVKGSAGSGDDGINVISGSTTTGSRAAIFFSPSTTGSFATGSAIKTERLSPDGSDLQFHTCTALGSSPTERLRIGSNGNPSFFDSAGNGVTSRSSAGATTSENTFAGFYSATSTANGTASFVVRNNGNVLNTNNSYGSLSDIKLKENIVDANSQWSDLKALQVRNYNLKEGQTHTQIGLVAQEVELVSPGLVSESPDRDDEGNDLGTVTKSVNYSVLYMKAVKALQEAMARIETLEARLTAAGIE